MCGYPERFAQEALGHNSKAIHRAYARKAQVRLPSLESYEKQNMEGRIIPLLPPLPKPESKWSLDFGGWLSVRLSRNRHSRLRQ